MQGNQISEPPRQLQSCATDCAGVGTVFGSSNAAETPHQTPVPLGSPDLHGGIRIGNRVLASRYFLAPLAGYTHLAFRQVIREQGGVGLCTTDLVQATYLLAGHKRARDLIHTNEFDRPLTVQIFSGQPDHLVRGARRLEELGYEAVDINMGCPMAKITGVGGGARLMCDPDGAVKLVERVVQAVKIPVSVKMRLGWDRESITAPALAREFEKVGAAAITIHGRTRQQGFTGRADLDGIRAVVEAVESVPVVGNGDVRTVADALHMRRYTGCPAVAIGRGAMLDPWIFQRMARATVRLETPSGSPFVRGRENVADAASVGGNGCGASEKGPATAEPRGTLSVSPLVRGRENADDDWQPSPQQQIDFLARHFHLMCEQHPPERSTLMFRKFAAWYGARLGIPEDLEDRLRRFTSIAEFDAIVAELRERHGTRRTPVATADVKVPNGPVELW